MHTYIHAYVCVCMIKKLKMKNRDFKKSLNYKMIMNSITFVISILIVTMYLECYGTPLAGT